MAEKIVLLVSACLLGCNVKYNGNSNERKDVLALAEKCVFVPVCPEQLGGLSTPRPAAEIQDGDGHDVLLQRAAVRTAEGEDRSAAFVRGAEETMRLYKVTGAEAALLKARSPSCGSDEIYNGSFKGITRAGNGVTAALLKQNGVHVFHEEQLSALCAFFF